TVYNHFGEKKNVLRALLEEHIERLLPELAPAPPDPPAFEASLVARPPPIIAYNTPHRGFFVLPAGDRLLRSATGAARDVLGPRPLRHVERFRRALRDIVEEGALSGALRPLDFELLARHLGGALRAVFHGMEDELGVPTERARLAVSLFLHGAHKKRAV